MLLVLLDIYFFIVPYFLELNIMLKKVQVLSTLALESVWGYILLRLWK